MRAGPFRLLCGAGLLAIFSSTISKSPALPLFAAHLGADPSRVGLVASVSAFTGILVSIPAGMMSDRFGRRRMLIASALVFATAPFLYLYVDRLWQLALVRFYHGLATAIFIPVSMALVSDLYKEGRGEKIGWFSTATLTGRFIAPIVGGLIIGTYAADPAFGFDGVYLLCGLSGLLAFFLIMNIPVGENTVQAAPGWSRAFAEFKAVANNRSILATSAVEAAILFAYGTFETFLPLYVIRSGHSAYEVGIILSSQVITLALTKPFMGRFSDKHGRRPQIIAGALAGAACMVGVSLSSDLVPLILLSVLFGLSISIVTSATSAYVADLSCREGVGSAMGILGSIMDTGHTTGPLVSGFIAASFGFGKAFVGASIVLVFFGVVFWFIAVNGQNKSPAVSGGAF